MSVRCVACNTELHDSQMVSKREVEIEDGKIETFYEDMCHTCRGKSRLDYSILEREYPFDDLTDGMTPSTGFSDDY